LSRPSIIEEEYYNPSDLIKPVRPSVGDLSRPVIVEQENGAQVLLPIGRPLKPSDLIKPSRPSVGDLSRPSIIDEEEFFNPSDLIKPSRPSTGDFSRPNFVEQEYEGLVKPNKPAAIEYEEVQRPSIYPIPINQQFGGFAPDRLRPVYRPSGPSGIIF
jgi:hypothetical protein